MALPWRTFTESQTLLGLRVASKVSSADLGTFYNLAYRELVASHPWAARKADTIINTADEYSTGTVSVTSGSNAVTGSSTVWTATHDCLFIRIADDEQFYKIASIGSNTSLTLEAAFPGATASGQTYVIFGLYYALPTDCGVITAMQQGSNLPIRPRTREWILSRDATRRCSGDEAEVWVPQGMDTSGRLLIEFWPRFSAAASVRVAYDVLIADLSGSSQPIIRSDLIETRALEYAADHCYAKFGDRHWLEIAQRCRDTFSALWDLATRDDLEKHNAPSAMDVPAESLSSNWRWVVTHDVEVS